VRDHEGNGCAEVCIRTLKPNPRIPCFTTLENPRLPPGNFKHTNNQRWIVEHGGNRIPGAVRGAERAPPPAAA
jgi:hypothetical protein